MMHVLLMQLHILHTLFVGLAFFHWHIKSLVKVIQPGWALASIIFVFCIHYTLVLQLALNLILRPNDQWCIHLI